MFDLPGKLALRSTKGEIDGINHAINRGGFPP